MNTLFIICPMFEITNTSSTCKNFRNIWVLLKLNKHALAMITCNIIDYLSHLIKHNYSYSTKYYFFFCLQFGKNDNITKNLKRETKIYSQIRNQKKFVSLGVFHRCKTKHTTKSTYPQPCKPFSFV